jgi:hypothetical protein
MRQYLAFSAISYRLPVSHLVIGESRQQALHRRLPTFRSKLFVLVFVQRFELKQKKMPFISRQSP